MIFLISLVLALILVFSCSTMLKKKPGVFYIATVVVSIAAAAMVWFNVELPPFISTWVLPVFARGGLAGALFVVVMVTGALPNGSMAMKRLMPVRSQISVIASILTLGHNAAYGKTYFVKLFTDAGSLPVNQLLASLCSVAMLIIMLPLFVTSFRAVRRKMKAKTWKRLQRAAYVFYALLCCHILLLTIPYAIQGRSGYRLTVFVYSFVFLSYGVCRIIKAVCAHRKSMNIRRLQGAAALCCAAISCMLIALVALPAQADNSEGIISEKSELENIAVETGAEVDSQYKYIDGTYQASAMGNNGDITVSVTVEKDTIVSIVVDSHRDDEPYISDAMEIIDRIIYANGTDVDTVSGATWSSGGILDAVILALKSAES